MTARRALVTGGSGDIGAAICTALAAEGLHVVVHANSQPARAQAVVDAITARGGSAEVACFDLTDAEACAAAMTAILERGALQVVVHNAGIHDDAPMAGMSADQWHRVVDVSLNGFYRVVQPTLLPMARGRFGRVIAISSVAAQTGNRGQVNYAAAKAGLHGACQSLAREMASRGITANVVAPGLIEGRMSEGAFTPEQVRQIVPAQRAGQPDEVAAVVRFLATDAAAYVNGQVIGVNGGMA